MPSPPHAADASVQVIYEDEGLLVLSKPAGLTTTAPDNGPCLTRVARSMAPRADVMHPSSRLDRDVTGVVTFAKTHRAIKALLAARRSGRYRRTYVALVSGEPLVTSAQDGAPPHWTWRIGIDPHDKRLRVALDEGDKGIAAREAKSEYEVRGHAAGVSALHLFPRTGRTHQLRVHCAKAGAPILGDLSYGGPTRVVLENGRVITARRPLLHCARVELPRPGLEPLDLRAPIHEDLVSAWSKLGGSWGLDP